MNCRSFQDELLEYVEGALSADERAVAEEHLASCDACRQAAKKELQLAQAFSNHLRQSAETLTLRPDIRRNILAASRRASDSSTIGESVINLWKWIRLAAIPASLLLMVAILIHFSGTVPPKTIIKPSTPVVATQPPQSPVSIQISYQMPTYKFQQKDGHVVDTLSDETVVSDGTFHPASHETFSQEPEMKMPL